MRDDASLGYSCTRVELTGDVESNGNKNIGIVYSYETGYAGAYSKI